MKRVYSSEIHLKWELGQKCIQSTSSRIKCKGWDKITSFLFGVGRERAGETDYLGVCVEINSYFANLNSVSWLCFSILYGPCVFDQFKCCSFPIWEMYAVHFLYGKSMCMISSLLIIFPYFISSSLLLCYFFSHNVPVSFLWFYYSVLLIPGYISAGFACYTTINSKFYMKNKKFIASILGQWQSKGRI